MNGPTLFIPLTLSDQLITLLLALLALAALSFLLLTAHVAIVRRNLDDARALAALPHLIATLGDDVFPDSYDTAPSLDAATTRSEGRQPSQTDEWL